MAITPGSHFFKAVGITFHYLARGNGPLVVMQSVGWGLPGSYLWNSLGPEMEKKHTVLYLEPRGNGKSSRPDDVSTMSPRVMAEDLEHFRKHLGIEQFPVLGGGSHSAAIVLRYAQVYPGRVGKLILIGAQVMDSPPNTNSQDWVEKRKDDPRFQPAMRRLMHVMSGNLPESDEKFQEGNDVISPWYFSNPKFGDVLNKHLHDGGDLPSVYALQTMGNDAKEENKLQHVADAGKVTARTLIIWGEDDAMCSLTAARALEKGIKGSKLVIIPGAGHCCWIEKPDVFFPAVDAFLKE
jgi:pimeloyl-ACP methyl ester carboxylesterase